MSLDGADADTEIECDALVGMTRCEGLEHRPFARAQGRNQPRRLGGITLAPDRVFLLQRGFNRLEQVFVGIGLFKHIDGAGLHSPHRARHVAMPCRNHTGMGDAESH